MGIVIKIAGTDTGKIEDAVAHNVDIMFRTPARDIDNNRRAVLNGNLAVAFRATKGAVGTNSTGLTVKIYPIILDPTDEATAIVGATAITLVSALDWTTAAAYFYTVEDPIGPCEGIRVEFTYANGVDDSEEIAGIESWLIYE
jgi:hypothetical protein